MDSTKENAKSKRSKVFFSAFTIMIIMLYVLAIITHLLPTAQFEGELIVDGSGVLGATLSQTLMAPVYGFVGIDGTSRIIEICFFILMLGAFLKMVNSTNAIEDGIKVLIRNLKGKELKLIPILMIIFSISGTIYGMPEETIGFYILIAFIMVAAGMDTVVSFAVVILGVGSGIIGSTINPFTVGVATETASNVLPIGYSINYGIIIGLGALIWLSTLAISIYFVMHYAKKVIKKKGSTILSLQEQKDMNDAYVVEGSNKKVKLSGKQKLTLVLFAFTIVVMILGFIPWEDLVPGVFEFFASWTGKITGQPLGYWHFNEASLWILIMTIIIGIVNGYREHKIIHIFVDGADDTVGIILIIAIAKGISILMQQTYLDNYIISNISNVFQNTPKVLFTPLNYLLQVGLSILVPSSSGMAVLSSPIIASLAYQSGYSVEVLLMEMISANGVANLFTPTCGVLIAGLAISKVQYTTWLKWATKVIITIAISNMIILTLAMVLI